MTVSTDHDYKQFAGTGSLVALNCDFKIFNSTDVKVIHTDAVGTDTLYTAGVDYTVGSIDTDAGTFIVTLTSAHASGETVTVKRDLTYTQTSRVKNQSSFQASTHENFFDKIIIIAQNLLDRSKRSPRVPDTVDISAVSMELPKPQANGYWKWNAAGTAVEFEATVVSTDLGALTIVSGDARKKIRVNEAGTGLMIDAGDYVSAGGTADAFTATFGITGYSTKELYLVKAASDNTGACTGNFDSAGIKNVKLAGGSDPVAGDIRSGQIHLYIYDGTNLVLINPAMTKTADLVDALITTAKIADNSVTKDKADFIVGYCVGRADYRGDKYDATAQVTEISDALYNDDGTSMFLLQAAGTEVFQYTLSTPYDVTTASYASKTYNATAQIGSASAMAFGDSGTKLYIADNVSSTDTVYQYNLSTAYDVSTASYSGNSVTVTATDSIGARYSMHFNSAGDRLYMSSADGTTHTVYRWNLSTAWDISTASYSTDSFATGAAGELTIVSPDEKYLLMYENSGDLITLYRMQTAGDLSTAFSTGETFDTSGIQGSTFDHLNCSPDGRYALCSGNTANATVHRFFMMGIS